ncbi:effector-associated domain EAD1-containing protein [Frankia sp. AgKG'84/4]|uniref:effector-associated domain EAD1-containing protein n=1 Tax=Frankia sp. AgKG'84/4 TaxID=573490 RepID=UPI00200C10CE|nr:effector-associated domain EAD1-containing protein [Frankia sp. AgKG'84/4]MCL9794889.1 effector-associated domain EAD1-containing protein [Frankia sp. AgKG'84/4]
MTQKLSEREIEALSRTFCTRTSAIQLLEQAGLSRGRAPVFTGSPGEFWSEVSAELDEGLLLEGRARILAAAAKRYPANAVFAAAGPARRTAPEPRAAHAGRSSGWAPAAQPRHASLFCLDARGYSKNGMLAQIDWRNGLRGIVEQAMRGVGLVDDVVLLNQDHGDGCLVAVDGSVEKARLASDFVRELRIAQREFNAAREGARLRLRMSLHQGDVIIDGKGAAGDAVVVTARLIDAEPVRAILDRYEDADLVLALSPEFYRDTVAERLRDLDPSQFRKIPLTVGTKFSGSAWVTLPGSSMNPPADGEGKPAPGSGAAPPFPGS